MTAPQSLTQVALAALAVLAEGEMHPYEMYQLMLARREDRVVKVTAGSLYRAVERLEQDGLITTVGVERSGNRPERTVYAITDAGREALHAGIADLIRTYENEYPRFPLGIGEAHNLPREEIVALLQARRASLGELRAFVDESLGRIAERGVPRRYVLNVHYWQAMLGAEDAWLVALLDDLREGRIDWPDPGEPGAGPTH
ncbi:PadR family transcriptional regulator [Agromyces sp. MMS24-JH15]|uniref:PadR family transcriptional regulator n=1 Tax=Agromyces sp. MMS24-JH15 TaxID=3243765 RepID=UPI0037488118